MPITAPELWYGCDYARPVTEEMKWDYIRSFRAYLLRRSDWTHVEDSELSGQDKQAAKDWRHEVRMIQYKPDGVTNPDDIVFPDMPPQFNPTGE